jgi:hypothetical protein
LLGLFWLPFITSKLVSKLHHWSFHPFSVFLSIFQTGSLQNVCQDPSSSSATLTQNSAQLFADNFSLKKLVTLSQMSQILTGSGRKASRNLANKGKVKRSLPRAKESQLAS